MTDPLDDMRRCFQPRAWFRHEGEPDPFPISEEDVLMWVYRKQGNAEFVVGYFAPDGQWFADSTYATAEEAAARVRYLNGGNS